MSLNNVCQILSYHYDRVGAVPVSVGYCEGGIAIKLEVQDGRGGGGGSSSCLSRGVVICHLKLLVEASPHSHVFPFLGVYFPTFDSFDFGLLESYSEHDSLGRRVLDGLRK